MEIPNIEIVLSSLLQFTYINITLQILPLKYTLRLSFALCCASASHPKRYYLTTIPSVRLTFHLFVCLPRAGIVIKKTGPIILQPKYKQQILQRKHFVANSVTIQ